MGSHTPTCFSLVPGHPGDGAREGGKTRLSPMYLLDAPMAAALAWLWGREHVAGENAKTGHRPPLTPLTSSPLPTPPFQPVAGADFCPCSVPLPPLSSPPCLLGLSQAPALPSSCARSSPTLFALLSDHLDTTLVHRCSDCLSLTGCPSVDTIHPWALPGCCLAFRSSLPIGEAGRWGKLHGSPSHLHS